MNDALQQFLLCCLSHLDKLYVSVCALSQHPLNFEMSIFAGFYVVNSHTSTFKLIYDVKSYSHAVEL